MSQLGAWFSDFGPRLTIFRHSGPYLPTSLPDIDHHHQNEPQLLERNLSPSTQSFIDHRSPRQIEDSMAMSVTRAFRSANALRSRMPSTLGAPKKFHASAYNYAVHDVKRLVAGLSHFLTLLC